MMVQNINPTKWGTLALLAMQICQLYISWICTFFGHEEYILQTRQHLSLIWDKLAYLSTLIFLFFFLKDSVNLLFTHSLVHIRALRCRLFADKQCRYV